jgi:hypothetical protein
MKVAFSSELPISALNDALLINKHGDEYKITHLALKVEDNCRIAIAVQMVDIDSGGYATVNFNDLADWECQLRLAPSL